MTPGHPVTTSPRALLALAFNFIAIAALGSALGGFEGALGGASIMLALQATPAILRLVSRKRHPAAEALRIARRSLKTVAGLTLLPIVLPGTVLIAVILQVWRKLAVGVELPSMPLLQTLHAISDRGKELLRGLVKPDALPLTLVNVILLLFLAGLFLGVDVAFYGALLAVPVMILTLLMMAIESSAEPEDDAH